MIIRLGTRLIEKGWLPLPLIRLGVRSVVNARYKELQRSDDARSAHNQRFIQELKASPIALVPEKANEQHYEVPADLFEHALGRHLKYSSCYFPTGIDTLDAAEAKMLALSCDRAELKDGMKILELGCGWGSLTLWMAEHFPAAQIVAVSNSASQRAFIEARAAARGLGNIRIITADMNDFSIGETFDRIVSVEMFEHMRNYEKLFAKIRGWLKPDGKLFVHIFCHRNTAYPYETEGDDNWMGRYFFSGGIMPSEDLFSHFSEHIKIEKLWRVSGTHYMRTARCWRERTEQQRGAIKQICARVYGAEHAELWYQRWRVFFLACEELFGFKGGEEWYVCHYLFAPAAGKV